MDISATDFDALANILYIYIVLALLLPSDCGGMALVLSGDTLISSWSYQAWVQPGRSNLYN